MSTRKERATKAKFWLTCRGCGKYREGPHFNPFSRTYICKPKEDA